jgi:isoquinoline 1-oxidoreductase subunit beta
VLQDEGNTVSALSKGVTMTSEYRVGIGAHAPLETQVAVAATNSRRAKIWTSTQGESAVADMVARALGWEKKQVEVVPTYVGGGFGRKSDPPDIPHVAVEAARLSLAVGAPVHVGWDRKEEMQNSTYRPPTHHRFRARLDANGYVQALLHEASSGYVILSEMPRAVRRIIGFDPGGMNGAWILYNIPNRALTAWKHKLPLSTSPWRGMGLFPNTFAVESFIDELAHTAKVDPLHFRLNYMPKDDFGARMSAVLKAAAERAGWGTPAPAGRARGIACCQWTDTVVAEVAEISLDGGTGKIRVHKVTAAIDCGKAVNPNQVAAQVEGAIVMGTSASLLEEIMVKDGHVEAENFDTYPLITMAHAPDVETIILDTSNGKPHGVGEPPIGPIGAAIGNAFFTLTGVRLRQLPMTPERVLKALNNK